MAAKNRIQKAFWKWDGKRYLDNLLTFSKGFTILIQTWSDVCAQTYLWDSFLLQQLQTSSAVQCPNTLYCTALHRTMSGIQMCIIDEIQYLCGSMHISFACLELVVRSVGCRLVLVWAVGWCSTAYSTACLLLVQAVSWCSAAYSTTGAGCKVAVYSTPGAGCWC